MASSTTPLLNSYKTEFVLRRLPRTFLGGPNLKLGYSAPFYVYVSQIILWLMPWIFGGIFTLATELGGLNVLVGSILTGGLIGIFVLIAQGIYLCKSITSSPDKIDELTTSQQLRQLISDDDEIYFDSFCSPTTFEFIIPPKKFRPNVLFHAIISGAVCGLGFYYSLPSQLNIYYNTGPSIVVYIFSWVTICIAQYPLTVGGLISEVATFNSNDDYEVTSLSRSFHVFIFYCVQIAQIYHPSLIEVNQILHIIFCVFPILWLTGILPPIHALILWSFEQFHIFGLGSTPMATDIRLLTSLFITGLVLLGGCFLPSSLSLVLYSSIFSFVLSLDFVSFLHHFISKLNKMCNKNKSHQKEVITDANLTNFHIIFYIFMFSLNVLLSCLFALNTSTFLPAKTGFHIAFIALLCVCKILQESQKVYVFFRLFRNFIYPQSYTELKNFNQRKKVLSIFGYINMALLYVVNPLVMSSYLSAFMFIDGLYFPSFINSLATLHAFRMVWQRNLNALLSLTIVGVIEIITTNYSTVDLGWFETTTLGVRLLVVDICVDRLMRFLDNIWFMFALLVSSWSDKKQRRGSSTILLIILNILFLPITITIAAVASIISAPVLPLFTLPLFYVGFPRPMRFWPKSPGSAPASTCPDTVYYSYSVNPLVNKLNQGFKFGVYNPIAGLDLPFLIARSQDKTFWIQTLESGFGYTGFNVKGLELQETSCHALEATRLDDQCQVAFEKSESQADRLNPYPFLSLITPVDTIFIEGYSDARNSLTGIIDNPDALKKYHKDFMKIFVALFIELVNTKKKETDLTNLFVKEKSTISNKNQALESKIFTYEKQEVGKNKNYTSVKAKTSQNLDLDSGSLGSLGDILSSRSNSQQNNDKKSKQIEQAGSVVSFSSLLSDDDDPYLDVGNKPVKNGNLSERNGFNHPGYIEDEYVDDLSDSGFSFQETKLTNDKNKNMSPIMSSLSEFDDLPLTLNDLKRHHDLFDRSWYLHVTSVGNDLDVNSGIEDDKLMEKCQLISLSCYHIVNVLGVPGKDPSQLGANHLCKVFSNNIPWSPALDWLNKHKDLLDITLKSHRFAVKMVYDNVAMGILDEESDYDEIMESIHEYNDLSYIGLESSSGWREAVEKGKDSLFSINFDNEKNEYSSHMLIRRPLETHISEMSSVAIRSIWENLSLELLYATNDDEERYSIQAHQSLLRNLVTQSADPPLGYPIYSSKPIIKQV